MKIKKVLKRTSPVGYVAVKAIEHKKDPARRADAEAKAATKAEADRIKAEAKTQRRAEVQGLMQEKRDERQAKRSDRKNTREQAVESGQKPIARHGLLVKLYVDRVEGGKTVYLDGAAVDFEIVGKSLTARNQAVLTITGPRDQIQLRAKGSMDVKNLQAFAARVEAAARAAGT